MGCYGAGIEIQSVGRMGYLPCVLGCRDAEKAACFFQTAFVSAIGFAGVIAFGYSSVSGGASFLRT